MAIDDPIVGADWNLKDRLGNDLEIPNCDRYNFNAIDGFGSIGCFSIDPQRLNLSSPPRRSSESIDRVSRIRSRIITGAFR
jgi:hypothetical protein